MFSFQKYISFPSQFLKGSFMHLFFTLVLFFAFVILYFTFSSIPFLLLLLNSSFSILCFSFCFFLFFSCFVCLYISNNNPLFLPLIFHSLPSPVNLFPPCNLFHPSLPPFPLPFIHQFTSLPSPYVSPKSSFTHVFIICFSFH